MKEVHRLSRMTCPSRALRQTRDGREKTPSISRRRASVRHGVSTRLEMLVVLVFWSARGTAPVQTCARITGTSTDTFSVTAAICIHVLSRVRHRPSVPLFTHAISQITSRTGESQMTDCESTLMLTLRLHRSLPLSSLAVAQHPISKSYVIAHLHRPLIGRAGMPLRADRDCLMSIVWPSIPNSTEPPTLDSTWGLSVCLSLSYYSPVCLHLSVQKAFWHFLHPLPNLTLDQPLRQEGRALFHHS